MASRIAAGRATASSHFCGCPHVAIVFLCPLPSSPRCRRLPISGVVFLILARTTSFLWPLIHRPPVVTAASRHVVVIIMGSGVIFSTSPPQLAFANKRGGMGDSGSFSLLSLPLLVVIVIEKWNLP